MFGDVELSFTNMEVLLNGKLAHDDCFTDLTLMVSILEGIVRENNGSVINHETIYNEEIAKQQSELEKSSVKFTEK